MRRPTEAEPDDDVLQRISEALAHRGRVCTPDDEVLLTLLLRQGLAESDLVELLATQLRSPDAVQDALLTRCLQLMISRMPR